MFFTELKLVTDVSKMRQIHNENDEATARSEDYYNNQTLNSYQDQNEMHVCYICNQVFDQNSLDLHFVTAHANEIVENVNIDEFPKTTTAKSVAKYECNFSGCDKAYTQPQNLKYHIERDHEGLIPDEETCSICNKKFKNKNSLRVHMFNFHQKNGNKNQPKKGDNKGPPVNKGPLVNKAPVHKETNDENQMCNICNKMFKNKNSLRVHVWNAHQKAESNKSSTVKSAHFSEGPLPHQKTESQVRENNLVEFNSSSYNKSVTETDHSVKPPKEYKCDLCNKEFSQNHSLKIHVQSVHEGIKKQCKYCDKTFSSSNYLKMHINRVHKGPFESNIPMENNKTATTNVGSQEESKEPNVTEKLPKKFQCDSCDKSFTQSHNLKRHVQCVHEGMVEERQVCPQCNKSFKNKNSLNVHIWNIHRKDENKASTSTITKRNPMDMDNDLADFIIGNNDGSVGPNSSMKSPIINSNYGNMEQNCSMMETTKIGINDRMLDPNSTIGNDCGTIDPNSQINTNYANCTMMDSTKIGINDGRFDPNSSLGNNCGTVDPNSQIGSNYMTIDQNCTMMESSSIGNNNGNTNFTMKSPPLGEFGENEQNCTTEFPIIGSNDESSDPNCPTKALKPHKCDTCGKSFSQAFSLRSHIQNFHSGARKQCKYCNKEFLTQPYLKSHIKRVHKHSFDQDDMVDIVNLVNDSKEDHIPEEYTNITEDVEKSNFFGKNKMPQNESCEVCKMEFESAKDMMVHTSLEHLSETIQFAMNNL